MNGNKTVIIAAVITFIIGVLFGFNLRGGSNDEKANLKQLLSKASSSIENLEKENMALKADLELAKKNTAGEENRNVKNQLKKARQDKDILKKEISALRMQLAKAETRLNSGGEFKASIERMKLRISALEKENHELNQVIDTIRLLTNEQETAAHEQTQ